MSVIVKVVVQIFSKLVLVITFDNNVVIDFSLKIFCTSFSHKIQNAPNKRRDQCQKARKIYEPE